MLLPGPPRHQVPAARLLLPALLITTTTTTSTVTAITITIASNSTITTVIIILHTATAAVSDVPGTVVVPPKKQVFLMRPRDLQSL